MIKPEVENLVALQYPTVSVCCRLFFHCVSSVLHFVFILTDWLTDCWLFYLSSARPYCLYVYSTSACRYPDCLSLYSSYACLYPSCLSLYPSPSCRNPDCLSFHPCSAFRYPDCLSLYPSSSRCNPDCLSSILLCLSLF
jgi:hypothetical protein